MDALTSKCKAVLGGNSMKSLYLSEQADRPKGYLAYPRECIILAQRTSASVRCEDLMSV